MRIRYAYMRTCVRCVYVYVYVYVCRVCCLFRVCFGVTLSRGTQVSSASSKLLVRARSTYAEIWAILYSVIIIALLNKRGNQSILYS